MKVGDGNQSSRMAPEDLAYQILKRAGSPLHYRDLFGEILKVRTVAPEKQGRLMAEMHTQINLDPRFTYCGDARWGLREWNDVQARKSEIEDDEEPGLDEDEDAEPVDDGESEEEIDQGAEEDEETGEFPIGEEEDA